MTFTFDYEETLIRRISIDANSLLDAIAELRRRLDDEEIVLDSEDFAGGKISMPMEKNFLPQLERLGASVDFDVKDVDLVIDYW